MSNKELIAKLNNKNAVIGIIGMGYVGLPLMLRFTEVGYSVLGIDSDSSRVSKLNEGLSYIEHIQSDKITLSRKRGFVATADMARSVEADAIIICVPTPLGAHQEPDLSFVTGAVDSLLPYLRRGQIISLESTTYPGTTYDELKPRIESTGLIVGKDIFLVFSPEREDPGNTSFITKTIPKVCGGITEACLEAGIELYKHVVDHVVPVSSTQVAEMTKLLENIYRAVNIGLVNEMKIIADKMNIDIHEVIRAASTKPFGFVPYYPGPGLGGHCIPIDPYYLTWKAREYGIHTRFIELAGEVNGAMPAWVINKIASALNYSGKPINGSNILILGIAYKKNVDDMRESASVVLMELLRESGAEISYSDPHIPTFPEMSEHSFNLSSIQLTADTLATFDCVLIGTNHDAFDYSLIQEHAKLIIDTRGVYVGSYSNVVKA